MMFREHRGSLSESKETMVRFQTRQDLIVLCHQLLWPYHFEFTDEQLHVDQSQASPPDDQERR